VTLHEDRRFLHALGGSPYDAAPKDERGVMMSKVLSVLFCLSVCALGCGNEAGSGSGAAATNTAAAATQKPTAAAAATSAAAAATPAATAAAAPGAQKGLEAGQVIVGYIKDTKDPEQCAALPAPEAEKAKWDAAKLAEVAKTLKSEVVASCPADTVGTCKMMGMLVGYSGPKYTKESAQKHCSDNRGKWIE
jgi:hypothetical protein